MAYRIRRRDKPGTQQKIDDVCHDLLVSLQGLDARAKEYEAFVGELGRLGEQGAGSSAAQPFLQSVQRQLARLQETLGKGQPLTPMGAVVEKVEVFRSGAKTNFEAFQTAVVGALSERQAVLAAYRGLARGVRDEAGRAVARSPGARDVCERARGLAGQVLRKRYYLEADWRGEQPLGEPEVSYEEIVDL